jgi:peroxiredoxin
MAADRSKGTTTAGRKPDRPTNAARERARAAHDAKRRNIRNTVISVAVAAAVGGGLYGIFQHGNSAKTGAYGAGSPGIGAAAPAFNLPSSTGGDLSLASLKGKTVLLYFQEGLTCQPCWDQMSDLEKNAAAVKAAGVDQIVSVTSDPAAQITQKTSDMHLATPVLSDPNLAVSKQYSANSYGMMGDSRDGHTFILIGPDGTIRWRADYGGAPNYTMFVPTGQLLTDLKASEK